MPASVLSTVFAAELPRLEELVLDLGWIAKSTCSWSWTKRQRRWDLRL